MGTYWVRISYILTFISEEEIEEQTTSTGAKNYGGNTSFERFCNCTSLHGWKYLSNNVNIHLRFGWVAVVLASMGVAAFFLGYSCNDFLSSTVQTTQDTSRYVIFSIQYKVDFLTLFNTL